MSSASHSNSHGPCWPAVWARRILKPMGRYREIPDGEASGLAGISPLLELGERELGVYENPKSENAVVVTTQGVLVGQSGRWRRLAYSEIEQVVAPDSKKGVTALHCLTKEGGAVWLPISGVSEMGHSDVFEFIRFLDRVSKDQ